MSRVMEVLRQRRSIRRYQERAVEPERVDLLKEALLLSPSSRSIRPWRFFFVTDREKLEALSHAKPRHGSFLAEAPLAVAICADESASDAWIEDSCIAAIVLQLAAADLGLASCWVQIRMRAHDESTSAEEAVRETLGLPASLRVECVVAIGYPAEEKPPLRREDLEWEAIQEV